MDTSILVPVSKLREWQLILESQNPQDATFTVAESIFDVLTLHDVKEQSQKKKPSTFASEGLAFSQIYIGKSYRVRQHDSIRPPTIRGALFKIIEKKRTNVVGVLEEKVLGYEIGTRFNLKPIILEDI